MRFSKRKLHFGFFFFYVGEIETKKESGKDQKPYKKQFFKVVIQNCETSQNGFLAKIA